MYYMYGGELLVHNARHTRRGGEDLASRDGPSKHAGMRQLDPPRSGPQHLILFVGPTRELCEP
jgi:hypothetical protein